MWITGFDAACVSTVYFRQPNKGHTLNELLLEPTVVYDGWKGNGLIVGLYGNVYKQLEKHIQFMERLENLEGKINQQKPVEPLEIVE